jgi:hypothetical protein
MIFDPITVKAGETAYLGIPRHDVGAITYVGPSGDGAYFIVSDKSARDLPLARSKKDTRQGQRDRCDS